MGLGLGLFLSGLILITWQKQPSREEIISRARGYGMVFREEVLPLVPESEAGATSERAANRVKLPDAGDEVIVTIPAGAFLEEISLLLESKGVVDAEAFEAEVHRQGVEHKLKAGSYYLPRDDIIEVIKRLTR